MLVQHYLVPMFGNKTFLDSHYTLDAPHLKGAKKEDREAINFIDKKATVRTASRLAGYLGGHNPPDRRH